MKAAVEHLQQQYAFSQHRAAATSRGTRMKSCGYALWSWRERSRASATGACMCCCAGAEKS
jgi:hypothetical protein